MKNVWKFVAKCLGVNNLNIHDLNGRDLSYGTTNLFVSIGDKSVYFRNFAEKGILRVGDLISNKNELKIKSALRVLHLSPLDAFMLVFLIDALPTQWRESLKTCISTGDTPFNLRDEIKLSLWSNCFTKRIRNFFTKNFETESSLHQLLNFEQQLTSERQFLEQNLWFNSLVRINSGSIYYREWECRGIRKII